MKPLRFKSKQSEETVEQTAKTNAIPIIFVDWLCILTRLLHLQGVTATQVKVWHWPFAIDLI